MKSRSVRTAATATRFRRKPLITALEPRLLLDGAAVATAVELATDVDFQEQSTDGTTDTTVHSASAEDAVHFTEVPAPVAAETARREVAFVDTQVEDYQTLVAGVADGVEVFLIDAGSNGLEQMLAQLQGQSGIDAIHVYSHGDVGQLTLGSLTLDAGNLSENANLLAQLGETLSSDADLMLYGCYVGGDSAGQSFIEGIAALSGADVAASDDLTGSGSLSGDWDLEASAGLVETRTIAPEYSYTLDTDANQTFNFGSVSGSSGSSSYLYANLAGTGSGTITITANDVDWDSGERDAIYFKDANDGNETFLGYLGDPARGDRGVDGGNSVTTFSNVSFNTGGTATIRIYGEVDGWSYSVVSSTFVTTGNSAPLFDGGTTTSISINEDGSYVGTVAGRDGGTLNENVTLALSTGPSHGTLTGLGYTSGSTSFSTTYTYTPYADYNGSDTFTFRLYDGVDYTYQTVSVNVASVNDAPSFTAGASQTASEDAGAQTVASWATSIDKGATTESAQTLTFVVSNNNTSLFSVQPTIDSTGTLRYTAAANASGSATVSVYAQDNGGTANGGTNVSPTSTFTITVDPLNDAPTLTGMPTDITVTEDVASNVNLSAVTLADVDSSDADFTLSVAVGAGKLSASSGGGVTVSGSNSGSLLLTGTVASIDSFLNTASNIKYTGISNANGNDSTTLSLTANDQDGSGNIQLGTAKIDITAVNDAPILYANALDGALSFDGSDDYASFAFDDSALTTAFTLETWIRWTPDVGNEIQFISGKGFEQMELHTSGGGVAGTLRFIPTGGVWLDAANTLLANQWTHIAAVYDATNTVAKLYINGEEVPLLSTGANPVGTALQTTATLFYLGQRDGGGTRFDGAIGEFRIWSTARTAAEIQANWNGTLTGSEAGLLNLWRLNEDTGSTVTDSVAPGTAGTITGATWIPSSERTLTAITENDVSNAGNLVSDLLADAMSDPDSGALEGIAITSVSAANGSWEYSLDNGNTWQSVGMVAESSALLLRASDKVRFAPDGMNGTTATFTFKAWDRTSGTAGALADTQTDGGSTAFSEQAGSAKIEVTAVNDLPTIQGLAGATVNEDYPLSINGFTIADVDSGAVVRVRVQANDGTLSLASSTGVTGTTSGATLDFSGSVADVGSALNSLRYAADANFNGTDNLSVEISDDNGVTWQIYTVDQTGKFYNPDNGHYYEFVSAPGITWTAAKTAAEARTLYGLSGYLVTVTSAEENAFIYPKLGGNGWMGASDAAAEGIWKWETGPEAGTQFWTGDINAGTSSTSLYGSAYNGAYANWASGEPNNSDASRSGEDVAHFYSASGLWNDFAANNTASIAGYIVEYGGTGYGTLQAAPFTVTVTSINDAPVFTSSAVTVSLTDTSAADTFSAHSGTLTASDDHSGAVNEDGTLSYGISGGTDSGTVVSLAGTYGTLSVTKATGAYSYTPVANAINRLPAGSAFNENFTVTVSDGQGGTTNQTFTIQIAPANDLPIVVAPTTIALTDSSGASIAGKVGATLAASDVDTGASLSYAIDNGGGSVQTLAGTYGSLTINATTGAYVYTPNITALNALDANAADSFTLKVSDGSATVSTTLTIDITATAETAATYTEQDPATAVLTDTVIDTVQSYGGGYIEFALGSSASSETLGLQRVATASTTAGAVSIVGDVVYLGDGTTAKAIGQVDSARNGLNGQNLRINFAIDFANGNFESSTTGLLSSTVGQTIAIDGWTVVNDRVTLGATQHYDYVQKDWIDNTIAGLATPDDPTYPSRNISKTSPDSSSILTQATADNGGTNPYASGMQDFGNLTSTGFYTYVATGAVSNGGSGDSLQMKSSMWSEAGYEVVRGPYVYSTGTVNLQVGDDVSFYWKAEGGSDAYDVFGYIINVNNPSDYQIILNATGASASSMTSWALKNVVVDSAGEYRFVFVSGTFDATGGEALGAQLYIDDVKVTQAQPSGGIDSSVLEALAQKVTYANSADLSAANATVSRTITVTTSSGDATPVVHTSTKALTIQEVNDPVSLTQPATIRYTDTDAADSFAASGGQLSASDPDSSTVFTYGIVNGGSTVTTLAGAYGTLTLDASTGAYTYTPDADAINALSANASDSFTVQVSDGSGSTASRTLTVEIQSVNDAPLLGGAVSTQTFVENGSAALVDPNITISDPEGTHYGNGSLTFSTTANAEAADRFSILETNGISVSGSNVYAGGTLIGTIDSQYDGQDGRALRINLNADAYSLQVQALARSIAFSNPTDDLSGASRSIRIEVNDGGNGGTTTARYSTRTATMQVSAINDLPEITLAASSYTVEKVVATNPDGTLALTGLSFADADHGSLSVTLATTRYGSLTLRTNVSGGLSASDIGNNGSRSVTLTGTLAQINATLAASDGLTYIAGSGNDVITPGADYLRVTATDAASGQALAQKMVMVLPAVPNADSANIVTAEDGAIAVDIGAIIADINNNAGRYVFGTGSADLTDAGGTITTPGSITPFDPSKVIYASHDIDGDGDIDASDTTRAIGYRLDHGTLILDNDAVLGGDFAKFTYVPDADWSGVERFVYQYTSGDGTTSYIAETAIYVTAQNDAPEVTLTATQNVDEDTSLVFNNANRITLSDVDAGGEAMTLTLHVGHGTLTLAGATGLTVLEGADGSGSITLQGSLANLQGSLANLQAAIDGLAYRGQQDYNGSDTLTVTFDDLGNAGDGGAKSVTQTVALTVNAVNDNPVGAADANNVIEAGGIANATNGTSATGNVLTNDTDVDVGDTPSVNGAVTFVRETTAGSNASVSTGTTSSDGREVSGRYGTLRIGADGSYRYVTDESNAAVQALRISGQTLDDRFTYTLADVGGLTAEAVLTITIDGRNDNPVAVDDAATTIEAGGVFNATTGADATGDVLANDTDVDSVANGETKTVTAVRTGAEAGSGTAGTVGSALGGTYGSLTLNGDGSFTYVIDEANIDVQALRASGQTLQDRFTYTVTDTGGLTDLATITITIDGRNDTPVADAVNIDHTWPFGKRYSLDISSRFSDVDGAANGERLDFTISGLPDGLTYDAATGTISGTPSDIGKFVITLTARDAAGASIIRQFTLEVLAPPQAPATPPVAEAPMPQAPTSIDTTPVTNDTTPLPTGTLGSGLQGDPVQDSGYMPSGEPIAEPAQTAPDSQNGNVEGMAPDATPAEGRTEGATGTERILLVEGETRVSEVVSPDGRVTSVRASVQVEVDNNGQVVFNDIQREAFSIVGLSVASISSDGGRLSVSIADAARDQDQQTYAGELDNGEPLPPWIKVNETTGEITIENPPPGVNEITVRVKAIGTDGKVRMLDTALKLSDLLEGGQQNPPDGEQPDSGGSAQPVAFVPLAEQVAAEIAARDGYGERLIALLEAA